MLKLWFLNVRVNDEKRGRDGVRGMEGAERKEEEKEEEETANT